MDNSTEHQNKPINSNYYIVAYVIIILIAIGLAYVTDSEALWLFFLLWTYLIGPSILLFIAFNRRMKRNRQRIKATLEGVYSFLGAILSCNTGNKVYKTDLIDEAAWDYDDSKNPDDLMMSRDFGRYFHARNAWNYLNNGSNLADYADVVVKNLTFRQRRNLIHLLFKLAADDDGIKNDEWHRLLYIMSLLKMNKANYDYLIRQYVGLRTEFDDYSSQQQSSSSSSNSSSSSSTSSTLSADYVLLGLAASASRSDVQAAYHKLALQYHPDLPKNAGNQQFCIDQMAKINAAYERIMTRFS